jgi:hypothetical protein
MNERGITEWFLAPEAILGSGIGLATIVWLLPGPSAPEKTGYFVGVFFYMLSMSAYRNRRLIRNAGVSLKAPVAWKWFWRAVIAMNIAVYFVGTSVR